MRINLVFNVVLFVGFLTTGVCVAESDMYVQAITDYSNSNYEHAAELFQQILQREPENHKARNYLGQSLERLRKIPQAIEAYTGLEPFRSKYPDLDFILGKLYYNVQDYPHAVEYFQKAEKQGIKQDDSRYFQAYIKYQTGDLKEAKQRFSELENKAQDPSVQQGAKLYLGTIFFEEENPSIEKIFFVPAN